MKSLFVLFSVLLLLFSGTSCSKKNTGDPAGSFTCNNKVYTTQHAAYLTTTVSARAGLVFASRDVLSNDALGNLMEMVSIAFEQRTIPVGSFTYKSRSSSDFDNSKHFYSTIVGIQVDITPSMGDIMTITDGLIDIEKQDKNYNVIYELKAADGRVVKGHYTGAIQLQHP
jgi:hypothetical protein